MRIDIPHSLRLRSIALRSALLMCGALVVAPPLHAQEEDADRALDINRLGLRQGDAVKRLVRLIDDAKVLSQDLRARGQTAKAELLEKAIAIVTGRAITLETVPGAGNESEKILGDLRSAMDRMHQLLQGNRNNTDEVQVLGKRVVETLARVLTVLTGHDEVRSLANREENLAAIRRNARRLAGQQEDLRDKTRRAVPRTEAEKTSQNVIRSLEQLQAILDKLDRDSREALTDVEKAQEMSARLKALLDQQKRLRSETAIRAGAANELAPRLNRELAEMQALAKQARRAEGEATEAVQTAELAKELNKLARRQARLALEMERRAAIEKASAAMEKMREGEPDAQQARAEAEKALRQLDGARTEAMRKVLDALEAGKAPAENADKTLSPENIKEAIEAEKKKLAARADTARDQKSLERDLKAASDNARNSAAADAQDAIKAAARRAAEAAKQLAKSQAQDPRGASAEKAAKQARDAEKALRRALDQVKKAAQAATDRGKQAERRRNETAKRAAEAAERMGKVAQSEQARAAGLESLARDAQRALERASKEMQAAAKGGKQGNPQQAQEQARNAAERIERAIRNLRNGLKQRGDIAQRQGKVAEELDHLATKQQRGNAGSQQDGEQKGGEQKSGEQQANQMRKAAESAKQAQQDLKQGDHKSAGENQQQATERIERALESAQKAAQAAAERNQKELERLQNETKRAAARAKKAAQDLEQGAAKAKEPDAAKRMQRAADRMKQAEEEIRRSLKKLSEALPRGAERDRAAAKEQTEKAIRDLNGVRERHKVGDQKTADELKKIARQQDELEKRVRKLDEQLKRLNEKRGREQIQDAQSAMRDASRRLEEGDSDGAEQDQQRAQKSLEQADDELNEEQRKYRNLHQYELLFKLRDELKRFQRESQAHRETLQKIGAMVRKSGRVTRHINRSELQPLRAKIRALTRNVKEKAEAIEKERAVVYTYLLKGCATDLAEIEALLSSKEVGLIPQELLGDVVRRFEMAIAGLERELQERRDEDQQQQQGQNQGGQNQGNGPRPLVPPDAEIRMILVLQRSLNDERGSFLANRPDLDERTLTETEKARLRRLYHQQGSLAELFDTLRQTLTGGDPAGPAGPEVPDGGPGGEDGAEGEN